MRAKHRFLFDMKAQLPSGSWDLVQWRTVCPSREMTFSQVVTATKVCLHRSWNMLKRNRQDNDNVRIIMRSSMQSTKIDRLLTQFPLQGSSEQTST